MSRKDRRPLVALIADDSVSIREYLGALLQQNGVNRVLTASDGIEALRQMRHADPPVDIVFTDLDMPGMDGVDMLRRIAMAHRDVSVVVLSGLDPRVLSTVAEMSEVQGLEVLGMLGKPFSGSEVEGLLNRWRQARRANLRVQHVMLSPEEIDAALRADRVEPYYQLKTRMKDGEPVGVEALARIDDLHLGVLNPSSFLTTAEASHQIAAMTMRVLEKSLEQVSLWAANGTALSLAVNLAPEMLKRLDLPEQIAALTAKHRYPNDRLTLEITETRVDAGPELQHTAARLRIKGFQLSVDDFGTGDSGMSRLRTLPFTELKIDRSFVADALTRGDLRTMLQTSVDLAHRLRMHVVAEGVESWDQWRLLAGFDCDSAQGFLAGPALPGEQIPDSLTGWRARVRAERAAAPEPAAVRVH